MKKLLFIHIPKTAGISIYDHAIKCGIDITLFGKHEPAKMWRNNIKDFFSFAFVRNPYDRFMSSYYFYRDAPIGTFDIKKDIKKYKTFRDFCNKFKEFKYNNDVQFKNQIYFILNDSDELIVDYVGSFEELDLGWKKICDETGWIYEKLPHLNKTKHSLFEEEYDDEMKKIVYNLFVGDFNYFKYESGITI